MAKPWVDQQQQIILENSTLIFPNQISDFFKHFMTFNIDCEACPGPTSSIDQYRLLKKQKSASRSILLCARLFRVSRDVMLKIWPSSHDKTIGLYIEAIVYMVYIPVLLEYTPHLVAGLDF